MAQPSCLFMGASWGVANATAHQLSLSASSTRSAVIATKIYPDNQFGFITCVREDELNYLRTITNLDTTDCILAG